MVKTSDPSTERCIFSEFCKMVVVGEVLEVGGEGGQSQPDGV